MVAVEVVHFLTAFAFGTGVVVHLCQRFVAVGSGVDIGISAVWVDFLQEVAAVFFEDFGFNQLVVQVVEIVLYFAVGQFAVDEVAEVVVVVGRAVVGFQAVVGDGIEIVWEAETAWLPHPRYVGIGGFMRATACYG